MAPRSDRPPKPRPTAHRPATPHVRQNRKLWDRTSAAYERRCRAVLEGRQARAWGLWRLPESKGRFLGPVRGRRTLELGCGAARWSIALRGLGARPVGLDLSQAQLAHARQLSRGRPLPLVRANAEATPFRDRSFDLIFADWGAMTFADPRRTVPECARLLRPSGKLVFATASPIRLIAFDVAGDRQSRSLKRSYFDLHRVDGPESTEFQLPYGAWVELFTQNGFRIERLHETRAPPRARTPYLSAADSRWGRSWPMECIWVLRKD